MKKPAAPAKLIVSTVALGALVSAWLFLAPGALGGSTTYVVTEGVSMQPRFHAGDLALVRAAGSYEVGDIVAYHSKALNTIVLHRIVAHDGSRYVFKGDNNNFIDPERPTGDQLVGKLWVQVAGGGRGFLGLGSPKTIAVLIGLTVLLLFGGTGAATRRGRRRGQGAPPSPPRRRVRTEAKPLALAPSAGTVECGLAVSGLALALSLALALLAFAHRGQALVTESASYEQSGAFTYSADAPVGDVYPEGRVFTGDTIFLRLVDGVHVRFAYRFDAHDDHRWGGTASFAAVLRSSAGWRRSFPIQAPARFDGDRAVVSGTLSLGPIRRLIQRVEAQTAVSGGRYTLSLAPRVQGAGTLAGGRASTAFSPRLDFTLDPLALTPVLPDAA